MHTCIATVIIARTLPLQTSSAKEVVEKLLSAGLVPSVVKVACKPTHFNQKWQLADLEVLWHEDMLYIVHVDKTAQAMLHRFLAFRATTQRLLRSPNALTVRQGVKTRQGMKTRREMKPRRGMERRRKRRRIRMSDQSLLLALPLMSPFWRDCLTRCRRC